MRPSHGLAVAALYALLGLVGLTLAVLPGYASPVFPAAGLALVASLRFGHPALIYIWVGAAAMGIAHAAGSDRLSVIVILAAVCTGAGAALQAAIGRSLVARGLDDAWQRLESEGQLIAFLVRGGVLPSLASATVGMATLWALGVIESQSMALVWVTWYIGDLLGIVIFAPMALLFLVRDSDLAGERRRRLIVPIGVALALSVLVYEGASYMEHPHTISNWASWTIAVIALFFTGLLQVYLYGMTGQAFAIRRQNEALLRKQAELQLAKTVFENTGEAIVVTDVSAAILSVNPAFTQISGYSLPEVQGRKMSAISSGQHDAAFYRELWRHLLAEGRWQGEVTNRRKSGDLYTTLLTINAVPDERGAAVQYVGTFVDITEKKAAARKIEFMAYHDALTRLPNRTLGQQRASEAIERARRQGAMMAIVLMGLDDFKLVNDSYGHSVGDQLLQAVAERLRGSAGPGDVVSRLSGDEFILIMDGARHVDAVAAACEQSLAEVCLPYEIEGRSIRASSSIGIALYPRDGESTKDLLRKADTALLEAKRDGRNAYRFFTEAMNRNAAEYLETRDALAQAIQNSELELHYQPVVALEDGAVVGAEALIRWRHPQRGLVSPGSFISVAEQSGLIVSIGAWALTQACGQMRAWIDQGLPMRTVAVNLSAVQFRAGAVVRTIADALIASDLPHACLELELTESMLIGDGDSTANTLKALKDLGIRLAIDDFGTGYSSMSYLKRFRVDKIKIDASFVKGIPDNPEDTAIVRSIIQMAQALGLETTAEGIESERPLSALKEMGCTLVQGYQQARPMPPAEFADWMKDRARAR